MEDTFSNLETYGYIGLFLYSLGGGFVALVGAGVLSFMGKMDLTTTMFVAFSANALGDILLVYLARYQKATLLESLKKQRRKLALAHLYMRKYGSWIVLIQKFVYGIKTLVPIAIGLTKYDFKKFIILNFFSSIIWVLVVGFASYFSGQVLVEFFGIISNNIWIAPLILVLLAGATWLFMENATKKRKG